MGRSGPRGPSLYVVKGLCGKPVSYWKRWQISFPHSTYAENEKPFEIKHLLVFSIFPHYGKHPIWRSLSQYFPHFSALFRTFSRSEEHPSELQSLMRISYAVLCLYK